MKLTKWNQSWTPKMQPIMNMSWANQLKNNSNFTFKRTNISSRIFFLFFPSEALPPRRGSRNSGWASREVCGRWFMLKLFFCIDFVGEAFLKQHKRDIFLKQLKILTIDLFLVGLPATFCFLILRHTHAWRWGVESFRGFPWRVTRSPARICKWSEELRVLCRSLLSIAVSGSLNRW